MVFVGVFTYSVSGFSQNAKDTDAEKVVDSTIVKEEKRLKFGCGFGLSFVGGTNISLSPNLMYNVSDKVTIGGWCPRGVIPL